MSNIAQSQGGFRKRIGPEGHRLSDCLTVQHAGKGQVRSVEPMMTQLLAQRNERGQAEEILLKAGALQRAIFDSANFSSIATDARGVIQIFNVGAERMLGYMADEVVNKITPAAISDPQEVIARAAALSLEAGTQIEPGFEALVFKASRGIEDIYELTYIRKDGSRFPAVVSVTALRDAQEGIIGYLLIGTDNTARKQAEEELLKAGALQRAIFDSASFSSIATDARGVIQIFNVGAERMLGYKAEEVVNKITPADLSPPQEILARAAALSLEFGTEIKPGFEALVFKASRGIEDIYELIKLRKDGSRFPAMLSVTALRDAEQGIIGYLLIGTDNTARKQAEEELLKAGALQRAIFESANFSSIATDAHGVIQIFNVGAERMLGYAADEVVDKATPAELSDKKEIVARAAALTAEFGTHITPGFEALVFKAARGIEDIYELTYCRKGGSEFPAIVSVTALRDADEAIIGYLLIGTDNTARKQAEAALLRSEMLATAGRMAASIAHEINNPLEGMMNTLYLARTTKGVPKAALKYLEVAEGELNRIAHITRQSLGFYREFSVATSNSVSALIDSVLNLLQAKIRSSGAVVEQQCEERLQVLGIVGELRQVLANLLANSLDAIEPDGRIVVRASACVDPRNGARRVRIAVADSGTGMAAATTKSVFDPFFTTKGTVGNGLGLWVCKQLVEKHGGSIRVRSCVAGARRGTTFSVLLPQDAAMSMLFSVEAPAGVAGGLTERLDLELGTDRLVEACSNNVEVIADRDGEAMDTGDRDEA
jgi:PAS domain S-box-containing protein